MQATLAGDDEAYGRLVARHQEAVARWMHRFSRDPSTHQALVQDVFVEAWTSLAGWRREAPLGHWLSRLAVRVGYRHWRQRDRAPDSLGVESLAALPAPDDGADARETAEYVHAWLARLPPRDRVVLTLTMIEQRTVAQAADLLGWSRSMVKVQAHRARKKLARLLEAESP